MTVQFRNAKDKRIAIDAIKKVFKALDKKTQQKIIEELKGEITQCLNVTKLQTK